MFVVQPRRLLSRPKSLFVLAVIAASFYWILLRGPATSSHVAGLAETHPERPAPLVEVGTPVKGAQSPMKGESASDFTDSNQDGEVESPEKKKEPEEDDNSEDAVRKRFERESETLGK